MRRDRRPSVSRHHELPFGAELCGDTVRFRLWAPRVDSVLLRLEDPSHGYTESPMQPGPAGWFSLTTGHAAAGTRYRYVVDGLAVPDPASRSQPEGPRPMCC